MEKLYTVRKNKLTVAQISQVRSITQSCPTLCDPMNSSPPGSSVCGILQAKELMLSNYGAGEDS